jgi:fructokinase
MAERFIIVGLGEVLWDLLPDGPQFGGATANFAWRGAMLGAEAFVASQVGDEELDEKAILDYRR